MTRAADAEAEFKLRILKNARLFADVDEGDLSELARVCRPAAVQRGKPIARAGGDGAQIFIIQSGIAAELYSETDDEKAILVSLAGPGDLAGAVSVFLHGETGVDGAAGRKRIEAVTNTSMLAAPAADFLRICRRSLPLSTAVLRLLARERDEIARTYVRAAHHSLEMRLAAFFSDLAALSAGEDWNPVINLGRLSQSAIAGMLGVSREHVNRTLAMWERSGLIFQNKKGDIFVENARRLRSLATRRGRQIGREGDNDWLWEIDECLDGGLNQTALHLALEAAKRAPKDQRYVHRAVLATARTGAISEALALLEKHRLGRDLADEDMASLRPRLLRDLAFLEDPGNPDAAMITESAKAYEAVFEVSKGFYSGVNAAAGYALAGDHEKSKEIASAVSSMIALSDLDEDEDAYWRRTTLAECRLLQGDAAGAASLFEAAANAEDATPGKRATTRKLLKRLARHAGVGDDWIDRAAPQPKVMYFSGPLARESDEAPLPTDAMLEALNELLAAQSIGWAYGALASGADIVIAETLIAAGVSLNVYLPLAPPAFISSSVHIGGQDWRERFISCMRAAETIEWNRRANLSCDASYRLGAEVGMGKAITQAAQLETSAVGFFAVQGGPETRASISISNRDRWRARGLAHVSVEGDWPARRQQGAAARADGVVYFALLLQLKSDRAPSDELIAGADFVFPDPAGEGFIALFPTVEPALAAAQALAGSAGAPLHRCWLDCGVFSQTELKEKPESRAAPLVTGSSRPLTEAGRIYASEQFACAAALSPAISANFDYLGFTPTREKIDPCPLYLVRF